MCLSPSLLIQSATLQKMSDLIMHNNEEEATDKELAMSGGGSLFSYQIKVYISFSLGLLKVTSRHREKGSLLTPRPGYTNDEPQG